MGGDKSHGTVDGSSSRQAEFYHREKQRSLNMIGLIPGFSSVYISPRVRHGLSLSIIERMLDMNINMTMKCTVVLITV